MMIIYEDFVFTALLISNAMLLAAAVVAILKLQRAADDRDAFWKSPVGSTLRDQSDHDAVLRVLDARFAALETSIEQLATDDAPDPTGRDSLPYENAVRMVRHGASIDDLTRNCGLSASEARLLLRVHAGPAAAA